MLPESISCVVINTGNLINSKELKKKAIQTPSEEVFDNVSSTLHSWINTLENAENLNSICVSCINPHAIKVSEEERPQLKVSVKVFLDSYNSEDLVLAIQQAMENLDIHLVDSFILALPPPSEGEKFNLAQVKPLWSQLEEFVSNGKIVTIGISDLDTSELIELHEWTQVKPSVNQVNLESCCVMPPEMIAFAKANDIQLLTHNDPKELLPQRMLQNLLEPVVSAPVSWRAKWITRYSILIKCRGIIQNKGYLMCLAKNT